MSVAHKTFLSDALNNDATIFNVIFDKDIWFSLNMSFNLDKTIKMLNIKEYSNIFIMLSCIFIVPT